MQRIPVVNGQATIKTAGKVLVLPTGNAATLPAWNEYVLDPNRLTSLESPFGGLKGAGAHLDYAVGTISTPTDGVYLQDTAGNNSAKTISAGRLKELGLLSVNTSTKTITEEFIVTNTSTSNSPTSIDDGSSAEGWSMSFGTSPTLESVNGEIHAVGTCSANVTLIKKTLSPSLFTNKHFLVLTMRRTEASSGTRLYLRLVDSAGNKVHWHNNARFTVGTTNTTFVLSLLSPVGTVGSMPTLRDAGFNLADVSYIEIGLNGTTGAVNEYWIDNIFSDVGKWSFVEIHVPDYLAGLGDEGNQNIYTWTGSAYNTSYGLGVYPDNQHLDGMDGYLYLMDGSVLSDVYATGSPYSQSCGTLYRTGIRGQTKDCGFYFALPNPITVTYSQNTGARTRTAFSVLLPPSNGGRTNVNKIRLKTIITYANNSTGKIIDLSGNEYTGDIVGSAKKLDAGIEVKDSTSCISVAGFHPNYYLHVLCDVTFLDISAWIWIAGDGNNSDASQGMYLCIGDDLDAVGSPALRIGAQKAVSPERLQTNTRYVLEGYYYENRLEIWVNGILKGFYDGPVTLTQETTSLFKLGAAAYYSSPAKTITIYEFIVDEVNESGEIGDTKLHYIFNYPNMGASTYEFSDSNSTSNGLQNLAKPWIAVYDPATSVIDAYIFTRRPTSLTLKKDDSGKISEVTIDPGGGRVYLEKITHYNPALDSDSDLIPNVLEETVEGSIAKLFAAYGFSS